MVRLRDLVVFIVGAAALFATTRYFEVTRVEAEEKIQPLLSSPKNPTRRMASEDSSNDAQDKDLKSYRDALSQYPEPITCPIFKNLAENQKFRLHDFAKLRSLTVCPEKVEVDWTEFSKPQFDALRGEVEIYLAEKQEKWDHYLDLLYNSISSLRSDSERVKALQKGIKLAHDKKLSAQEVKLTKLLEKVAPRLRKTIQRADYLEVGQDFLSAREFDKARAYLKKVFNDATRPSEQRRKAYVAYRSSYKLEHDKQNHLKAAQNYYQWLLKQKDWQRALEAGLYVAKALWTEGMQSQAEKILTEVEKKLNKKTKTYEISFIRGRIAAEDGNHQKAIGFFQQALEKGAKTSVTIGYKSQYAKAWSLYHLNKFDEAGGEFAKAADLAKEQPDEIRAFYWQARSLQKNNKKEEAKKLFKKIAQDDPLGFYGLIAYRDSDEPIPAVSALAAEAIKKSENDGGTMESKILTPEYRQLISDLSFVGERKALEAVLNDLSQKDQWDWESPEGVELLRAYAKAGLYLPLFSILTKIPKELREQMLIMHPELLFPQDYADLITSAAEKESLPAELIFAIIRQESAFDPFARSAADAMGLMQVIPEQAKNIAKEMEVDFENHDDLYSPQLNIPIGSHLLKQGLDRYKGNLILAVASYNANDRAIKNWLKTRFRDDPLEFVEEIPYEETRAYVKLVLRNYVFYKRLKNPSQAMAFPNECLTNLQNFKTSTAKDVVSQ